MTTCHTYRECHPSRSLSFFNGSRHNLTPFTWQLPADLASPCTCTKSTKYVLIYCVRADETRAQVADWLESYAHSLELDVWTSSTVTRARQNPETKKWTVEIERANAEPRTFVVNHLVFATGFAGGTYKLPQIPGSVRVVSMPSQTLSPSNI